MNIKNSILANVVPKEKLLEEENVKIKEISFMARALDSISNFLQQMSYLKEDLTTQYIGRPCSMGIGPAIKPSLTKEEYHELLNNLKELYIKKIDTLKEFAEETFKEEEQEEEQEEEPSGEETAVGKVVIAKTPSYF